jgi:fumarylacetoacetase
VAREPARAMDASLRSWVPVPDGSDFPLQNLPFGAFRRAEEPSDQERPGVAIGERILDLRELTREGLLEAHLERPETFEGPLNGFLSQGRPAWRRLRDRLLELLAEPSREIRDIPGLAERVLVPIHQAHVGLPCSIGDYVDFYSSIEHASNMGRMFRPESDPLLPNWRWLPVGYHGRSGSIVPSGTPVVRPQGQTIVEGSDTPVWGPTRALDVELEMGFLTGPGNEQGIRISPSDAEDHIFGLVLVNDWSARDIQRWEYQPLGPFLGKSFATSISPWIVTLDALEPFRVPGPVQDPPPLGYLSTPEDWGFDIELTVEIQTAAMAEDGVPPHVVSRTNFRHLYWNIAQQLAHATSNGAQARPGDLFASGTVSGPEPGSLGSLIELTWRGTRPLSLPGDATRTYLEDGDTVVMRGSCGDGITRPRIGFGEVRGTILPSRA